MITLVQICTRPNDGGSGESDIIPIKGEISQCDAAVLVNAGWSHSSDHTPDVRVMHIDEENAAFLSGSIMGIIHRKG